MKDLLQREAWKTMNVTELEQLMNEMVKQIGTTDGDLRDQLIYRTFCTWLTDDVLPIELRRKLLPLCVNRLFHGLTLDEGDYVFTRSFAALVVALLLEADRNQPFLATTVVIDTFERSIAYMQEETDRRGYVDGKGWAHAIAHGADLLTAVIEHPLFDLQYVDAIFLALTKQILQETVYVDDEEERLVFVIEALLHRGVAIAPFLDSLSETLRGAKQSNLSYYRKRTNMLHFYRALYFRLHDEHELRPVLAKLLRAWK